MSFWEEVGAIIGHGIGALIYGPRIALKQRHSKTIRRAFATWLGDESYTKQIAEPGRVRRLVERRDAELTFLLECELRPDDDDVRVAIALEQLPAHAEKEKLELDNCLVRVIDHKLVLLTKAPEDAETWNQIANGAVKLAAELTRRHRGEGYR